MSMKCVGGLNHNLQHGPSEKPSDSPTATLTVKPSIYQARVAPSWPGAAVERAETHYICMKQIWHEYEVCGMPQT
jgi:hypothetical protein